MSEHLCPACKETMHGWSVKYLDRMPCPYCGAPLKKGDIKDDSLSGAPDNAPER